MFRTLNQTKNAMGLFSFHNKNWSGTNWLNLCRKPTNLVYNNYYSNNYWERVESQTVTHSPIFFPLLYFFLQPLISPWQQIPLFSQSQQWSHRRYAQLVCSLIRCSHLSCYIYIGITNKWFSDTTDRTSLRSPLKLVCRHRCCLLFPPGGL